MPRNMDLGPVERRSVADGVFEQLSREIVEGRFGPGTRLPSERRLSEIFQVNRGAVREAIQRLAQTDLLEVRHGESTRVLDFRRSTGLDLLSRMLFRGDGTLHLQVARDVLEMRAVLGPEVARRCAERSAETGQELRTLLDSVDVEAELERLQDLGLRFWDLLVAGSGNLAYQLVHNSLCRAYDHLRPVLAEVMAVELRDRPGMQRLAEAVGRADGEAAAESASVLLGQGNAAIREALDLLEALG